jgi:hypothetical protein
VRGTHRGSAVVVHPFLYRPHHTNPPPNKKLKYKSESESVFLQESTLQPSTATIGANALVLVNHLAHFLAATFSLQQSVARNRRHDVYTVLKMARNELHAMPPSPSKAVQHPTPATLQ